MRKFRLISEDYAGLEYGKIYDSDFVISDNFRTVEYYNDRHPYDWEEVFEKVFDEPKQLHKDTDLGYFSLEIMKSFISIAPYLKKDTSETANSDFVANCIGLSKELIKQLDAEPQ